MDGFYVTYHAQFVTTLGSVRPDHDPMNLEILLEFSYVIVRRLFVHEAW